MPCSLIMTATSSAVTALTKIGSVEGLKRRNLVVRDGGAKKNSQSLLQVSLLNPTCILKLITRELLETVMTSAQTLPELASKIFYFSLAASAFVFISMLLMTSLHP